jgi:hypothetical protein
VMPIAETAGVDAYEPQGFGLRVMISLAAVSPLTGFASAPRWEREAGVIPSPISTPAPANGLPSKKTCTFKKSLGLSAKGSFIRPFRTILDA